MCFRTWDSYSGLPKSQTWSRGANPFNSQGRNGIVLWGIRDFTAAGACAPQGRRPRRERSTSRGLRVLLPRGCPGRGPSSLERHPESSTRIHVPVSVTSQRVGCGTVSAEGGEGAPPRPAPPPAAPLRRLWCLRGGQKGGLEAERVKRRWILVGFREKCGFVELCKRSRD